ncbi:hypothetical protein [Allosphingosinicella sp.]|uniref:hypothetical protein n=1 Tax=Allosphingosinicella sp. TaxID=2823234 RepID=UPI002FC25460
MDLAGAGWFIMTVVGPLVLAGVLLWVLLRNRKRTPREDERTEQATRDLYREEDRAHRGENEDVP